MAITLDAVFEKGGKGLLELLHYCVLAVRPEPLFVFLVREYTAGPTAAKAVALFDVFCATAAEARLDCAAALPPRHLRLGQEVEPLRQALARARAAAPDPENPVFVPLPSKLLFDALVRRLREEGAGALAQVANEYDPERTPQENLPGGRMNASQRFFVERVWRPRLRPRLVEAGFRRVATLGG